MKKMTPWHFSTSYSFLFVFLISFSWSISSAKPTDNNGFLHCLSSFDHSKEASSFSKLIFTKNNSSYTSVLDSTIQNLRFSTPSTPKPLVIITPSQVSHFQAAIFCSRKYGLQIRTRSGGHDFEGLSYVAKVPFVVLDLKNFRSVDVDVENKVAWVQSGAILGEFYYEIAKKSSTLAFPAGICHTVGIGGYVSAGGYGLLLRKYGLAADNVIDAQLIDVNGRVLDRKAMGEDLFWAIRGAGGGSYGIVLAWKLKLVSVPATVTVSTIRRTLEQNATELVNRWQYVANNFPDEIFSIAVMRPVNSTQAGKRTIRASFSYYFSGSADKFVQVMQEKFPELGVTKKDCTEMRWIQSILYFGQVQNSSLEVLLDRSYRSTLTPPYYKTKTDYAEKPIPKTAFEGIWSKLYEAAAESAAVAFYAYGGKMDRISDSAIPFPHRKGNLFMIAYEVGWEEEDNYKSEKYLTWIRNLYKFMTPFVTKSPRTAFLNYRDNDVGINSVGKTSYAESSIWGRKYFKNNFDKLVDVKTRIDPENFFKHEQSIPPWS